MLQQLPTEGVPYEGIPYVIPQASSSHAETQAEVQIRTILSAMNTLSNATISMLEDVKPCGHEDELEKLKEEVTKQKD